MKGLGAEAEVEADNGFDRILGSGHTTPNFTEGHQSSCWAAGSNRLLCVAAYPKATTASGNLTHLLSLTKKLQYS